MLDIEIADAVGVYQFGSKKTVKNNATDQAAIEFLLNSIDEKNGGTCRKVKKGTGQVVTFRRGYAIPEDGKCDANLALAIYHFQRHNKRKLPVADGVVDRGGQTLKLMNRLAVLAFGPEEILPPIPIPVPPPPKPSPTPKPTPSLPSVGPFFNVTLKGLTSVGSNGVKATLIFNAPPASVNGGLTVFEYEFNGTGDAFDVDSDGTFSQLISVGRENAHPANPFGGLATLRRSGGLVTLDYDLTVTVNSVTGPKRDQRIHMSNITLSGLSTSTAIGDLTLKRASR